MPQPLAPTTDTPETRADYYRGVAMSALEAHSTAYSERVNPAAFTSFYHLPERMQEAIRPLIAQDELDEAQAGFREIFPNLKLDLFLETAEAWSVQSFAGRHSQYREQILSLIETWDAEETPTFPESNEWNNLTELDQRLRSYLVNTIFLTVGSADKDLVTGGPDRRGVSEIRKDPLEVASAIKAFRQLFPQLDIVENELGQWLDGESRARLDLFVRALG